MFNHDKKYRLLTRSDFDGLGCAILLKELGILGEIKFVHPKDMQDGLVRVTADDILTNVPYHADCHLCFDHHASEGVRVENLPRTNHILHTSADSAARVVYEYYGGQATFPDISTEMLAAIDQADSARFTRDQILSPSGWALLSFLMDARTGLGRFRDFRVSNYELMMSLIDYCRDHTISQILELPDVKERVRLYDEHAPFARDQIQRCSQQYANLVVLDLRFEETIYATNRFTVYSLFPSCNISIHVLWGKEKKNTVFTIGRSILNRTCRTDIGALCLEYGGGGHEAAGTCQVPHDESESVLAELIARINADASVVSV
ncbi:MAG: exopolyphosphatase [Planctomycetota bacterium]|nr:exopolyphosphatase [Planctomycetota bacterium]